MATITFMLIYILGKKCKIYASWWEKKQKKWIIIRDVHKNWQERKYYKISLRRLWILEEVEFNSSSIIKFILFTFDSSDSIEEEV